MIITNNFLSFFITFTHLISSFNNTTLSSLRIPQIKFINFNIYGNSRRLVVYNVVNDNSRCKIIYRHTHYILRLMSIFLRMELPIMPKATKIFNKYCNSSSSNRRLIASSANALTALELPLPPM